MYDPEGIKNEKGLKTENSRAENICHRKKESLAELFSTTWKQHPKNKRFSIINPNGFVNKVSCKFKVIWDLLRVVRWVRKGDRLKGGLRGSEVKMERITLVAITPRIIYEWVW